MARQPRTRAPKKKFQASGGSCRVCGAGKFLYVTKTGPVWQCSASINH